jgi:hypothetical protein
MSLPRLRRRLTMSGADDVGSLRVGEIHTGAATYSLRRHLTYCGRRNHVSAANPDSGTLLSLFATA